LFTTLGILQKEVKTTLTVGQLIEITWQCLFCSGNITECLPWLYLATRIEDTDQQAADSNADERIPAVWSIL